jgi:hypothetical protein
MTEWTRVDTDTAPTVAPPPWWRANAWLLVALLPYLVLAAGHWPYLPSRFNGDYAQYILHAKALVEGRSYGDIGYLFTPYNSLVSPREQPPGWPLLLAPGVALFGTGFLYPRLVSLLAGCVFLACAAHRVASRDGRWVAIGAVAMTGVSLEESFSTNTILSDLPFAALVWVFLVVADRDGPVTWGRVALLLLVGTFAMSVRVVGVAVIPTIALFALMRRGPDRMRLFALAGVWVIGGAAALLMVGPGRIPFLMQALRAPMTVLGRLEGFWRDYQRGPFSAVMYPFPNDLTNDLYHAAALVLMAIGLTDLVRRFGRSATGAFALCYLALLAIAPTTDIRYLWPLWPLMSYAMIAGARRAAGWRPLLSLRIARAVGPGVAALVLLGVVTAFRMPAPAALLDRPDVQELFAWLRAERARAEVRVVFTRARVLTLETGVPAMPTFRTTPERTIRELDRVGITHVIVGDAGIRQSATAPFERFVTSRPDAFVQVWSNAGFTVYRYLGGAREAGSGGARVATAPPHLASLGWR